MKKKATSLLLVAAMTATMTAGCWERQTEAQTNTTAGNGGTSIEAAASDDAATVVVKRKHGWYIDCMEPNGEDQIQAGYRRG